MFVVPTPRQGMLSLAAAYQHGLWVGLSSNILPPIELIATGRFMQVLCMLFCISLVESPYNNMFLGHDRFLNFHGQYGARLSRRQSIHIRKDEKLPRSCLFKILSPMLFSAPNVHRRAMNNIWADQLVQKAQWGEFFTKLGREWQGHTVFVYFIYTFPPSFVEIRLFFASRLQFSSPPTWPSWLSLPMIVIVLQ